ncbi:hypothetical protein E2C01_061050 [Portunus trituberculatus]|uniref:Endonuclease/exonuclease/phosphatase domain-containing protein n=1 Tax=Portunus trituberculatus TaxID=210409 RepID=A0A5B7HB91_PORTR|nr:hypothetical protein [Portunus trituberculatus]
MATPNPASKSPSGEGTRYVPRSNCSKAGCCSLGGDPKCLDTSPDSFFINFCNIRGLRSNFQSVDHYLSSAKLHLFLPKTQLFEPTDSSSFSVPSYFLYPHFLSKAGSCVYVRNDLTCSCAYVLESSEFSTIWLRLNMEHNLSLYPFAEISILGDFNVHHQLWLSSPLTDHPGELAFNFAILHDLEELVQHPTCIPDCHGDTLNILDFFLTSNPSTYVLTVSSPLGSSDHNLIFCILSYFSNPSSESPKTEVPMAFCLCQFRGPEEVLC